MIRAIGIALLASVTLAACGGGAQTTENVQSIGGGGDTGDAPYTGPVAKDADVLSFQQNFWSRARTSDRCGSCHTPEGGQTPYFVRSDDVNLAYDDAVPRIDRDQPSASEFVARVETGHGCWVADPGTCATIMTGWIEDWVGAGDVSGGRQIVLTPPDDGPPSDSLAFPPNASGPPSFETIVWQPYLRRYCSSCHSTDADPAQQRQPFHADVNVEAAYEAAKPKIDLEFPENSQLVTRVREGHNSWSGNFGQDADELEAAIRQYAGLISPTQVDSSLITSNEITLLDGVLASGGNRYENDQIALWEFKTGEGSVAYDTSGVDPAIDLNFSGDVSWYGGWGITVGTDMAAGGPGKAQAPTTTSRKLHDVLVESGEFSIEAWVIPANVTQEMARIVSYSAGQNSRNVTLQQTLYNYDFLLRTNAQDANGNPLTTLNGDPQLSTPDMDEVLQATLQHVVATYDPINGRRIYVNGALATQTDPVPGGTLVDWQDNMAFILGNEADSSGVFEGTFRLVAVHRRALNDEQINQNFDAGVGERFYMLFDISHRINLAPQTAYILFEAQQFDNFAYLFDKPHFITLDGSVPAPVTMEGMRIAMNGQEAPVGQSYANIVQSLDVSNPDALDELGQSLSPLGAVLPLQQGPEFDKFFLTFDNLDGVLFDRPQDPMLVVGNYIATPDAASPDIGMKTFDEIDASYAAITGVDRITYQDGNGNFVVDETYQELRQSLPAVEDIEAFLSSHQVAIAQLAIQYCDAAVEANTIWTGPDFFDFGQAAGTAFASGAARDSFVEPLVLRAVGHSSSSPQIGSQPSYTVVHSELAVFSASGNRPDNLVDRLLATPGSDTRSIAKGVCAAVLGSAVTLVQ